MGGGGSGQFKIEKQCSEVNAHGQRERKPLKIKFEKTL